MRPGLLALHPPACGAALDEIKGILKPDAVLVSLAPKVTIARISEEAGRILPGRPDDPQRAVDRRRRV
ncbi:MAG: hypothetical protein MZV63_65770 [Marinilabiliales bacterium]|nr:hypothetical protein [Marinilabiliales bacterium]